MGKRKRYVVDFLCHVDGMPCINFDRSLGFAVCEVNGHVCFRFTLKNFKRTLEIRF